MDFADELSLLPGVESVWVSVKGEEETLAVNFDDDPQSERMIDVLRVTSGEVARVLISDVSIRVGNDELRQIVRSVAAGEFRTGGGCIHVRLPDGTVQSYC